MKTGKAGLDQSGPARLFASLEKDPTLPKRKYCFMLVSIDKPTEAKIKSSNSTSL